MSKSINSIDPTQLFYSTSLAVSKAGLKSAYVSTRPQNEPESKLNFVLSWEPIEPTDSEIVASLPNAPYGLSEPLAGGNPNRPSLEVTLEDDKVKDFFESVDQRNKKAAIDNSMEWFKKQVDERSVEDRYTPIVKKASSEKYKPCIRFKIQADGERATKIIVVQPSVDDTLNTYDGTVADIKKNSKCLIVGETTGLWFQTHSFGMSFNATEILVWKNAGRARGIGAFGFAPSLKCTKIARPLDVPDETEADADDI